MNLTKKVYLIRLANMVDTEMVEGYVFEYEGIAFGVCKNGKEWQVSDLKVGSRFALSAKTRVQAISNAQNLVDKVGADKVIEKQAKALEMVKQKQAELEQEQAPEVEVEPEVEEIIEEQAPEVEPEEEVIQEEEKPKKVWSIGQFFRNIANLEELKKSFKKFSKWLHPDVSEYENATEAFIALQKQYEEAQKLIKSGKKVEATESTSVNVPQDCQEAINKISDLEGIEIKIRGSWVWVAGVGRADKDKQAVLKAAGFRFGAKASEWFYASKETQGKKRKGKGFTSQELSEKWGEQVVKATGKQKLESQAH